jgi:hypothetical protein
MEVSAIAVDWSEVVKRSESSTLENDLLECDEEEWIAGTSYTEVFFHLSLIGEAFEAVYPYVSESNKRFLDLSLAKFIKAEISEWFETPQELDTENSWMALSPETTQQLQANLENVDFDELQELYQRHCPEIVAEDIGHDGADFKQSLLSWLHLFREASEQKRGVILQVG